MDKKIIRHIDVCINRIQEASRLLDELCRFNYNLPKTQKELKEFRHLLKDLFIIDYNLLLEARDSINDLGFSYSLPTEATRKNLTEISRASCKRIIESLRILEEYAKLPDLSSLVTTNIESLRQKFYTIEKELILKVGKWQLSEEVYPINPEKNLDSWLQEISQCSSFIQLRLKKKCKREILECVRKIKDKYPNLKIIMNDHLDIALAEDLAGVHLGQDDLPLTSARSILGESKIIGVSTHDLEQAVKAEQEGADYIGFGPVFQTSTKDTGYSARGLQHLKEICSKVSIPVVGIGGINSSNFQKVLKAGATSCAMISDLAIETKQSYENLINLVK